MIYTPLIFWVSPLEVICKIWISNLNEFKHNFWSLNEFKWKSFEIQSFITSWDLQLWCSKFFHSRSFAKIWLQILERCDSSFEMLRFVNIICDKMCKIFPIFYHSLYAWYHQIMTNLMVFRLYLLFLKFKNHSGTCLWSCFLNKMLEIPFHFTGLASNWAK